MSEAHGVAVDFVEMWRVEVLRLVTEARAAHAADDAIFAALLRDADEVSEEDGRTSWRRRWAADHYLVWATHQLEQWLRRLDREEDTKELPPTALLVNLRDALEHLDDATFKDQYAVPGEGKGNRALRRLGRPLLIGTGADSDLLFDVLSIDAVERFARGVISLAYREEAADDWADRQVSAWKDAR